MLLSINLTCNFLAFILTCLVGKKIGNLNAMRLTIGSASLSVFLAFLHFNDIFFKGKEISLTFCY